MSIRVLLLSLLLFLFVQTAIAASVNINTADAAALATLDGVGDAKAEAIIAYRNANGPFKTVEELANVKGIGEKLIELNRGKISVGTAAK
ncbi:MAG: competence protein ComEA [Gammaproteobacteria bacterium]|nr:MAG: competence protein ComEA [Gammaproteobacteria bacterium]TND07042.1 MAG: competence protein ComEA [Gammaproteobacteria bacterium]